MRLFCRFIALSALLLFFIFFIIVKNWLTEKTAQDLEDEAAQHILESITDDAHSIETNQNEPPPLSLNIAIILIVALLTLALLITGICCIIVVAITMDPNEPEDVRRLDDSSQSGTDDSDGEFNGNDRWKSIQEHLLDEKDIFPDFDRFVPPRQQRLKSFSY
uniref:Uncharacterized protein n=1 Tax=Panagrolaimus sp. JU765 TaxID=591449 RepID=A0AC34R0N1_9BILA